MWRATWPEGHTLDPHDPESFGFAFVGTVTGAHGPSLKVFPQKIIRKDSLNSSELAYCIPGIHTYTSIYSSIYGINIV